MKQYETANNYGVLHWGLIALTPTEKREGTQGNLKYNFKELEKNRQADDLEGGMDCSNHHSDRPAPLLVWRNVCALHFGDTTWGRILRYIIILLSSNASRKIWISQSAIRYVVAVSPSKHIICINTIYLIYFYLFFHFDLNINIL